MPNLSPPRTAENFSLPGSESIPGSKKGQTPTGGPIPGTVEAVFDRALSGDALKVWVPAPGGPVSGDSVFDRSVPDGSASDRSVSGGFASGASSPAESSGEVAGRTVAVVYLWGIQAPRPSQPFGTAATGAAARLCRGRRLAVAARRAGPEGRIAGSVAAQGNNGAGGQEAEVWSKPSTMDASTMDVGRALVRRGLAWQDQRGSSSAQLRALEQEARRREAGLWQQEAPTPPWAWGG